LIIKYEEVGGKIKMKASEVLEKLNNREREFTSEYTEVSEGHFSYFKVFDEKLFNALSEEEKLKFSNRENKYPRLYLYSSVYLKVEDLNVWVLIHKSNIFDSRFSYTPSFLHLDEHYLLKVETETLYVKV